jgi:hypothetical protein
LALVENSSPVWEVLVDDFSKDLLIILNTFRIQDLLESSEETSCKFCFVFSFNPELDDGTSGVERFDDFVFVIAGKDESAIASKFLNKRP